MLQIVSKHIDILTGAAWYGYKTTREPILRIDYKSCIKVAYKHLKKKKFPSDDVRSIY